MRTKLSSPQADQVLRFVLLAERVGAAIALVVALLVLFGLRQIHVGVHIGSGLLALLGILLAAARLSRRSERGGTLWAGAMVAMLVAVGLTELAVFQSAGPEQKRR